MASRWQLFSSKTTNGLRIPSQPFGPLYDESWAARALRAPVWQNLAFAVQRPADFGLRSPFWRTLASAPFVPKRIPSLYFFRDAVTMSALLHRTSVEGLSQVNQTTQYTQ